jgi:2'-5' RNA ligase
MTTNALRLFVAIDLPEVAKGCLATLAEELERQTEDGRFVHRDNFHLTMAFIGETGRVNEAHAVVRHVNQGHLNEPLKLRLWGIGSFPGAQAKRRSGAERGAERGRTKRRGEGRSGTTERGETRRGGATERSYTWWVGIAENPEPAHSARLTQIADILADELRAAGFVLERRSFKPHITLGRGVRASRPVQLTVPECSFAVRRLELMKSDLSTGRPVYTAL